MNSALTLLLFCIHLATVKTNGSMEQAEVEFATLCPSSVCNSTLDKPKKFDSCCQRCSCKPDCYKVASCCPDVYTGESSEPEYPCIDLEKLSNDERGIGKEGISDKRSYRIVDRCPDEDRANSYPRCAYPSSLNDYVLVSDLSYEKVFRNWHCANCHGVADFIPWDLFLTCEEVASAKFETFEERDAYIFKHCRFMPTPPDVEKADMSRCYIDLDVISKCNVSHEWNYYDHNLERACVTKTSNQATLYHDYRRSYPQYYSNVYCFVCNKPKHFDRNDICRKPDPAVETKFRFVGFTAFIQPFQDKSTAEGIQCRSSDVWDPFDAVCRRMYCPSGTIPRYGNCQSNWKSSEGFSMVVLFEVISQTANDIIFYDYFYESAFKRVVKILGSDFHCGICDAGLHQYMNDTSVYIEFPFFTTKSCIHRYLIAKLRELAFKEEITMTLKTVHKSVTVILKVVLKNKKDSMKLFIKTFGRGYQQTICKMPVQLDYDNMITCPRVKLTKYEYDEFNLNQSPLKSLFGNASLIDSEKWKIAMCVEEYFLLRDSIMSVQNGFQQVDQNVVMTFIFILLICI